MKHPVLHESHRLVRRQRRHGTLLLVPQHEWTNHGRFQHLEEARLSVFRYIETFYYPQRLHQTLGYLFPYPFEAVHAPATAA